MIEEVPGFTPRPLSTFRIGWARISPSSSSAGPPVFCSGDLALLHDLVDRHETVNVGIRVRSDLGVGANSDGHRE